MVIAQHRLLARLRVLATSMALASLWCGPASSDTLFKCVDASGHVAYQQRPCDTGSGAQITTKSVAPKSTDTQSVSVPVPPSSTGPAVAPPTPAVATGGERAAVNLPPTPPAEARGRLDGWPATGYGLVAGMSGAQVISRWGRPHDINIIQPDAVFFHYCDFRVAFIYKGELVSWSAMFPDSQRGAGLYTYGDPWIRAAQKWGNQRDHKSFSNSATDRGEVQQWTPNRWVVTDAQGRIVSWCDAADDRRLPVIPPQSKTAWE